MATEPAGAVWWHQSVPAVAYAPTLAGTLQAPHLPLSSPSPPPTAFPALAAPGMAVAADMASAAALTRFFSMPLPAAMPPGAVGMATAPGPGRPSPVPVPGPGPGQAQIWAPTPVPAPGLATAKAGAKAGRGGGAAAAAPPVVSHSSVEKQRRDRINSLIDQLRELVPPEHPLPTSTAALSAAEAEARRPKHTVLADTIALLKHLQQLEVCGPAQAGPASIAAAGAQPHATQPPHRGASAVGAAGSRGGAWSPGGADASPQGQRPASPSPGPGAAAGPSTGAGAAPGPCVRVEAGPTADCYYVRVRCPDRKGLLVDIMDTLRRLPLEVRTASITTANGMVRDVFEVRPDDPAATSTEVLQAQLQAALFGSGQTGVHAGGKRTRG
ncbi:hypothetical protein HYH03_002825 [Edaphochlamys debaryana]|uniref:BHLH domain-containing protein n=1 Tax=Edaphochlamys debaryana TaxID=47281 RepID=A0A835YAW2_9CHLO|nr:hypothetical protein HYH03_002825 [Edaphochlamys debaryana]|eukprot:KAG2499246.1 hypothetical protein HYH03_002825 [Edaphochlamys debaryana]